MAERSPVVSPLSLEAEATFTLENSLVEAAVQALSKSIPSCGWMQVKKFTGSMAMRGESLSGPAITPWTLSPMELPGSVRRASMRWWRRMGLS